MRGLQSFDIAHDIPLEHCDGEELALIAAQSAPSVLYYLPRNCHLDRLERLAERMVQAMQLSHHRQVGDADAPSITTTVERLYTGSFVKALLLSVTCTSAMR